MVEASKALISFKEQMMRDEFLERHKFQLIFQESNSPFLLVNLHKTRILHYLESPLRFFKQNLQFRYANEVPSPHSKNGSSVDFKPCTDPDEFIPFIGIPHPNYGAEYFRRARPPLQLTEDNIRTFCSSEYEVKSAQKDVMNLLLTHFTCRARQSTVQTAAPTCSIKWIGASNPFPPNIVQVQRIMKHRIDNNIPAKTPLADVQASLRLQGDANTPIDLCCLHLNPDPVQFGKTHLQAAGTTDEIDKDLSHTQVVVTPRSQHFGLNKDKDDEDTATSPDLLSKGYVTPLIKSCSRAAKLMLNQSSSSYRGIKKLTSLKLTTSAVALQQLQHAETQVGTDPSQNSSVSKRKQSNSSKESSEASPI
ncbi:hypothetical protein C2S51_032518 [Perilla frutescens var. frutescens]|nr:hypothetical protein C2S51_032518 [Perilla frutescens var. frutescens]